MSIVAAVLVQDDRYRNVKRIAFFLELFGDRALIVDVLPGDLEWGAWSVLVFLTILVTVVPCG